VKLTIQQLKRIIKEELRTVLDEDLPGRDDWQGVWNDCVRKTKNEDYCTDLAAQIYGDKEGKQTWDDETIKKHLDHEYGEKRKRRKDPKDPEGLIGDWATQMAADHGQRLKAKEEEKNNWEQFYNLDWSDPKIPNFWIVDRYKRIFGQDADLSINKVKKMKPLLRSLRGLPAEKIGRVKQTIKNIQKKGES